MENTDYQKRYSYNHFFKPMSHFEYLLSSLCLFNSAFRSTLDSVVQRSCSLLPSTGWIKQNYVVNVATHCETQTLTALKMNKSRTISFKLKIPKGKCLSLVFPAASSCPWWRHPEIFPLGIEWSRDWKHKTKECIASHTDTQTFLVYF